MEWGIAIFIGYGILFTFLLFVAGFYIYYYCASKGEWLWLRIKRKLRKKRKN
jgi:hypothetical protein